MNNRHRLFFSLVVIAIVIKLSLFAFAAVHAPQGKILPDSPTYLRLADTLASRGAFAEQGEGGALVFETFRTPGYPAFLAIFYGLMKIPLNGIILLQIAMTILAAFIIYKTALLIEPKIAFLSAAIILLDPPITIFSLTILTESLFLLLISVFMFFFILYLKDKRISRLVLSAIFLALAAYVRPVAYYLGFVIPVFIIYANWGKGLRKYTGQALIFLMVVYSLVGIWQVRNYARCKDASFSPVGRENLFGKGLFHSYTRNRDPYTKELKPIPYYMNVSTRCIMSIMTRPGNLKYFGSDALTVAGKVFAYPWMIFWLAGFIWGILKAERNVYIYFLMAMVVYFVAISVTALMWDASERLRVPTMPFIAIISAYGWANLLRHCEPAKGG